jgi:ABC-type sugar transport system permease subunit
LKPKNTKVNITPDPEYHEQYNNFKISLKILMSSRQDLSDYSDVYDVDQSCDNTILGSNKYQDNTQSNVDLLSTGLSSDDQVYINDNVKFQALDAQPGTLVSLLWIIPAIILVIIIGYIVSGQTFGQKWYRTLNTAPWQPPPVIFSVVWVILYIFIAIAWYVI